MAKRIEDLLGSRCLPRLRIYGYSIDDEFHDGLIKVGQTTRDVRQRVAEQLKTAVIKNYTIIFDESAEKSDGTLITDHLLRQALTKKGFEKVEGEWMKCSIHDLKATFLEVKTGRSVASSDRHQTFGLRDEQAAAVKKTIEYFNSIWEENPCACPRFLWNAKMRFGKTFTSYKLAQRLEAKRVLVLTFKPAVEDAWQADLESHIDFESWTYLSRTSEKDPSEIEPSQPVIYFASFQDVLGRDKSGSIKPKNRWIHSIHWDLVIFDEYHFGAWRETAQDLFEGEDSIDFSKEQDLEYATELQQLNNDMTLLTGNETEILPIKARSYLYLSGTPFRALSTGEFIEEQIFNWTYTDEQRAKQEFHLNFPSRKNPYEALPKMHLMTYQMPDELLAVASAGEFDEFDLNTFFSADGEGASAQFKYKSDVQKWLDIIRGAYTANSLDLLKSGNRPPFPYADSNLLQYLQHSFWYMPNVSGCHAMANLLSEKHNVFWRDYTIIVAAGTSAGIGLNALPPVRKAIGSGYDTKTITLSCGKLTTGVTVKQWTSILMLRNLKSPESYFQAAFRVQSPWTISNPEGDDPNSELIAKPVCCVFDFAPTRALRQLSEYGIGLSSSDENPEVAVKELIAYLPVLAYDGASMTEIDAGSVLDIALAGTSGSLLARKWEDAALVNVDNLTLRRILDSPEAMAAVEKIEGWRSLGDNVIETIISKAETIKEIKESAGNEGLSSKERKILSDEEKEYKSKRKLVQEKLIKFATRIPAFMYLTDFRENTLQDVITKIEPDLFSRVTGLSVEDFYLLVRLKVFNTERMNQAVFAFRRYEDASLRYSGIDSHPNLSQYGLFDTVVSVD